MLGHRETVTYSGRKLDRQTVVTSHFQHVVFSDRARRSDSAHPTWLFLDGDGNSWLRNGRVAEDPTPTNPVALELMALNPTPAVYIARPCTFGTLQLDNACDPAVWTVDRYAGKVVDSLFDVMVGLGLLDVPVVVVGYSGGGVLALHLAARLQNAVGVLTIAANLDVDRWLKHHSYTKRLLENLPASPLPLRTTLVQLHVFGNSDDNAPYFLSAELLARDPNVRVRRFSGANHDCCWSELWPAIAADFQQLIKASDPIRSSSSVR